MKSFTRVFVITIIGVVISGCAQQPRHGMVPTEDGLMFGSVIERNLVVDAQQFEDPRVRVTVRNTSGDTAYNIKSYKGRLDTALREKGYKTAGADGYGLRFDVNVLYSGYTSTNMSTEYGFLGGAAGGLAGAHRNTSTSVAAGLIAGATLGAIIGSYDRADTYIIIAEVTVGVFDPIRGKASKSITFSRSPALQEERKSGRRAYDEVLKTKVAIYAGGRSIQQSEIVQQVRQRLVRILSDVI